MIIINIWVVLIDLINLLHIIKSNILIKKNDICG